MPFPSAGDLPNAGTEPATLHWQAGSLPLRPPGTVQIHREVSYKYIFGWRQIMFTYILSWQGCGQIFCNESDFFITVYANALSYLFWVFLGFFCLLFPVSFEDSWVEPSMVYFSHLMNDSNNASRTTNEVYLKFWECHYWGQIFQFQSSCLRCFRLLLIPN